MSDLRTHATHIPQRAAGAFFTGTGKDDGAAGGGGGVGSSSFSVDEGYIGSRTGERMPAPGRCFDVTDLVMITVNHAISNTRL